MTIQVIGLKARKNTAQGKRSAALGSHSKSNIALKGRDRLSLVGNSSTLRD